MVGARRNVGLTLVATAKCGGGLGPESLSLVVCRRLELLIAPVGHCSTHREKDGDISTAGATSLQSHLC